MVHQLAGKVFEYLSEENKSQLMELEKVAGKAHTDCSAEISKIISGMMRQDTALHAMTVSGTLQYVPSRLINAATLLAHDDDGETVWHVAARCKHLDLLPVAEYKEHLLVKNNKGHTPVYLAAINGCLNQIPEAILDRQMLYVTITYLRGGKTTMHEAAENHHLWQVPKKFMTIEGLSLVDSYGDTVLHTAARAGSVNNIPLSLLEVVPFSVNYAGETPLHLAARNKHLDQFPNCRFTFEALTIVSDSGESPIGLLTPDNVIGRDIPSELEGFFTPGWWKANKVLIQDRLTLAGCQAEMPEIDIF